MFAFFFFFFLREGVADDQQTGEPYVYDGHCTVLTMHFCCVTEVDVKGTRDGTSLPAIVRCSGSCCVSDAATDVAPRLFQSQSAETFVPSFRMACELRRVSLVDPDG